MDATPSTASVKPAAHIQLARDRCRRAARPVNVSPELPIAAESAALNARASV